MNSVFQVRSSPKFSIGWVQRTRQKIASSPNASRLCSKTCHLFLTAFRPSVLLCAKANSCRKCHHEHRCRKDYGCEHARHCGLITNGRNQATRAFSLYKKYGYCCFARYETKRTPSIPTRIIGLWINKVVRIWRVQKQNISWVSF